MTKDQVEGVLVVGVSAERGSNVGDKGIGMDGVLVADNVREVHSPENNVSLQPSGHLLPMMVLRQNPGM